MRRTEAAPGAAPGASGSHRTLLAALGRGLVALVLLGAAAAAWGPSLLHALAPAQRGVFHAISPDFTLVQWQQREPGLLVADVTPRRLLVVGAHVREPDPRARASASLPLAQALLAPVLLLAAALLAPGRWPRQALRVALALPLAAAWLVVDAPLSLAGQVWELLFAALSPGESSVLVQLQRFLHGGGRLALALAAGLLVAMAVPPGPRTVAA